MNFIRLFYLHRDHSNQKQYNSVLFLNPNNRRSEEIEVIIKAQLIDQLWLDHVQWGLPDLRTEKTENTDAQHYHEFVGVQNTEEFSFGEISSIDEFLEKVKRST